MMSKDDDICVIVDSRELSSRVPEHLEAIPGTCIEVRELSEGDYILHESVCAVERKSAADFALSIMDRRLFVQARRLKAEYPSAVVIIEGDIFTLRSGMDHAALVGALSWLVVGEGVSVVFSDNEKRTAELLSTMARHSTRGLGYEIALRHDKPRDVRTLQEYLIEGLPGVAGGKAKALLAHFGSPLAIFNASTSDLQKAPGIGKQLSMRIREVVHAMWHV